MDTEQPSLGPVQQTKKRVIICQARFPMLWQPFMQMWGYSAKVFGAEILGTIIVSCLTNGSKDELHWCAVVAPSC